MAVNAQTWKTPLVWIGAVACVWPAVTPPVALGAGFVFAVAVGNRDPVRVAWVQKYLLQASVVGLGFGIQFDAVLRAGTTGIGVTAITLVATLALGVALTRWMGVERTVGYLISTGTAICGGSAIAAMGPVLGAEARVMSVALGCVFLLNAVALFVFPWVGHWAGLSPEQFGLWAAIAIHDTSSVVGAAARYGPEALAVAVPAKLARALWILPLVALVAWRERSRGGKLVVPWFVLWFLAASAVASCVPIGAGVYDWLARAGKTGLSVTLFLIGASLSKDSLRSVGARPFGLGVFLWLVISGLSLVVLRLF